MVEAHGHFSPKVKRLHCVETDIVFPMARGRYKFRFSTSVIGVCGQKAPAASTVFNCVRSVKCDKETAQWLLLQQPLWIVHWSKTQARKEMAAMYNVRRGICWGSSCLILSLKIITLLQMRWVQTISRLPYCRIPNFSAFLTSNNFSDFCRQVL